MKKLPVAKVALIAFFSVIIIVVAFKFVRYVYQGDREYINTTETKKYINSIIKTDKNIQKAKIYTQNAKLQFYYTVKNEPNKDELNNIFNNTYEFLTTNDKCRDLLSDFYKQVYINIYYKEDWYLYTGRNFVDSKTNITNSNEENNWILSKNGVEIEKFTKDNRFKE
jgi:hypothetical protein